MAEESRWTTDIFHAEKQREKNPLVHSPVVAKFKAEPVWGQEPWASSNSLTRVQDPKALSFSLLIYQVLVFKIYFILIASQIYREEIHSPSDCKGQCCADPNPGANNFLHVSHAGTWTRGVVLNWFPILQAGMWSRAARIRSSTHMGFWHVQGEDFSC